MSSALAEGFSQGATKQRKDGGSGQKAQPPAQSPAPAPAPPKKSYTAWYIVAGGVALAVIIALLPRSR